MREKRIIPAWGKDARKAMIDRDMSINELAVKIGITNVYCSKILSGVIIPGSDVIDRICDELEIDRPTQVVLSL